MTSLQVTRPVKFRRRLCGDLSLEQAAQFVVARGRLMASISRGAAVAVRMSPEDAEAHIAPWETVGVAVVNGLEDVVLSGERTALMQCLAPVKEAGIATNASRVVGLSLSFLDHILEPLTRQAARRPIPSVPFYALCGRFLGRTI